MPKVKTSVAHKQLTRTYRPSRHDAPPLDGEPLPAEPPASLEAALHGAWQDIVRGGAGRLVTHDAVLVELAARLLTKVRSGEARAADVSSLTRVLGMLALDPLHRQGLPPAPTPEGTNEFDEF